MSCLDPGEQFTPFLRAEAAHGGHHGTESLRVGDGIPCGLVTAGTLGLEVVGACVRKPCSRTAVADGHPGARIWLFWVRLSCAHAADDAAIAVAVEDETAHSGRRGVYLPVFSQPRALTLLAQEVRIGCLPMTIFVGVDPPALWPQASHPPVEVLGIFGLPRLAKRLAQLPHGEGVALLLGEPQVRRY